MIGVYDAPLGKSTPRIPGRGSLLAPLLDAELSGFTESLHDLIERLPLRVTAAERQDLLDALSDLENGSASSRSLTRRLAARR